MISSLCTSGLHDFCEDCQCICHHQPEQKPLWMSNAEWARWLREFAIDFEPGTTIPIKHITPAQAIELRVMVYGGEDETASPT